MIKEIKTSDLRLIGCQKLDELGQDVVLMVLRKVRGTLNALDVRSIFWQTVHGMYTVYPTKSLTRNCSFDGYGVHSALSSKFDVAELWDKRDEFNLKKDIVLDRGALEQHTYFRKIGSLAHFEGRLLWVNHLNIISKLIENPQKEEL